MPDAPNPDVKILLDKLDKDKDKDLASSVASLESAATRLKEKEMDKELYKAMGFEIKSVDGKPEVFRIYKDGDELKDIDYTKGEDEKTLNGYIAWLANKELNTIIGRQDPSLPSIFEEVHAIAANIDNGIVEPHEGEKLLALPTYMKKAQDLLKEAALTMTPDAKGYDSNKRAAWKAGARKFTKLTEEIGDAGAKVLAFNLGMVDRAVLDFDLKDDKIRAELNKQAPEIPKDIPFSPNKDVATLIPASKELEVLAENLESAATRLKEKGMDKELYKAMGFEIKEVPETIDNVTVTVPRIFKDGKQLKDIDYTKNGQQVDEKKINAWMRWLADAELNKIAGDSKKSTTSVFKEVNLIAHKIHTNSGKHEGLVTNDETQVLLNLPAYMEKAQKILELASHRSELSSSIEPGDDAQQLKGWGNDAVALGKVRKEIGEAGKGAILYNLDADDRRHEEREGHNKAVGEAMRVATEQATAAGNAPPKPDEVMVKNPKHKSFIEASILESEGDRRAGALHTERIASQKQKEEGRLTALPARNPNYATDEEMKSHAAEEEKRQAAAKTATVNGTGPT